MTAAPVTHSAWKPPERRVLVFVAVCYLVIGTRLAVAPSLVSGGPAFAALFLIAGALVVAHALFPWHRQLRATAGALATVAPASRALVVAAQPFTGGTVVIANVVLGVTVWTLIAGLTLHAWAHVQPPPAAP